MSFAIRLRPARPLAAATALLGCLAAAASTPSPAVAAEQAFDVTASVRLVPGKGATLIQRGTFSGTPVGRGTIRLRTRLGQGDGATFSFVMRTRRGTLHGSGSVALDFRGQTVVYHGTADITHGGGAYAGHRARGLRVSGSGPLHGDRGFSFRLAGRLGS
jgi:hypothetical protein